METVPAQTSHPLLPEPLLILSKCIIRSHHFSDGPTICKAANTPNVASYLTSIFPYPYTLKDAEQWLTIANPSLDYSIVGPDNLTTMGGISLKPKTDIHYRTAEIGYWLGEAYWRQGIMSEAVTTFCGKMFERDEKLLRLEALVWEENEGSVRVLEKAGFMLEGRRRCAVEKNGVVSDELIYALLREGAEKIKEESKLRNRE